MERDPTSHTDAARRRPGSLSEAAAWGRAFGGMEAFLREFLDSFYLEPDADRRAAMLAGEPPLSGNPREEAYLAAMAEHLASRHDLPVPDWTGAKARFLKRPFFPAGLESLKATFLVESPTAFRRRMIFVGSDPLYRPRRGSAGIG
jgi:hypothetical protein